MTKIELRMVGYSASEKRQVLRDLIGFRRDDAPLPREALVLVEETEALKKRLRLKSLNFRTSCESPGIPDMPFVFVMAHSQRS